MIPERQADPARKRRAICNRMAAFPTKIFADELACLGNDAWADDPERGGAPSKSESEHGA
jgi:hypothetical protein